MAEDREEEVNMENGKIEYREDENGMSPYLIVVFGIIVASAFAIIIALVATAGTDPIGPIGPLCVCRLDPFNTTIDSFDNLSQFCVPGYNESGGIMFADISYSPLELIPEELGDDIDCFDNSSTGVVEKSSFACIKDCGFIIAGRPYRECHHSSVENSPTSTAEALFKKGVSNPWVLKKHSSNGILLKSTPKAVSVEDFVSDMLYEHASVATFARLTLELMATGAPPDLLDRALSAARDEVKHARYCATIYEKLNDKSNSVAPGNFPFEGGKVQVGKNNTKLVYEAVLDGLFGESRAAFKLIQSSKTFKAIGQSEIAELLLEMALDETRHAELGYKIAQWGHEDNRASIIKARDEGLRFWPNESTMRKFLSSQVEALIAGENPDSLELAEFNELLYAMLLKEAQNSNIAAT